MNIAVLEGYVCNPGDLSWDGFERYGDVTVYERTPRETLRERMKGVEIVIATKVIWDKEALDWSPDLKLIALASTGYNVVDLDEARRRGIMVCNVPAYSTPDVAQMTIALMLELCLNVGKHTSQVLDGAWTRTHDFCFYAMPLIEVAGKTLGIVGMGSIGQAVARIARAFDMEVLFASRSPKPHLEAPGVSHVELDELLRRSDVVSLHVPATPQTERMIDAAALSQMKDGALLINTARGTLVDERAVADALRSGKLAGFGADVVAVEPMRPDNPLLEVRDLNVAITPHIAWGTREARARLLDEVARNIEAFLEGRPRNIVK